MNDFWTAFTYINEQLYMPCRLTHMLFAKKFRIQHMERVDFVLEKRPFAFGLLKRLPLNSVNSW